jgi:hypothetical protein
MSHCIEDRNDIGELLWGTEFSEGLPEWLESLGIL